MQVQGLFVYPVKGCRGIPVAAAAVTPTGLPWDRQWMVVREDTGKFLTQRQLPKLCQVSVSLPPEALLDQGWGKLQPGAALVLAAPGMPQLQVPLTDPPALKTRVVTVWEWTGAAADEGEEAAAWFSKYLGKPTRLVRHIGGSAAAAAAVPAGEPTVRPADPEFAPGHTVKFADGFPLLVVRQENLEDLNNRMAAAGDAALPINRFRPNIVLTGGGEAWADDAWRGVCISAASGRGNDSAGAASEAVELQYVKPCSRCKVPTIDQETAAEGRQPLKALAAFRSGEVLGWAEQRRSWKHDVFFGINAAVVRTGLVHVGDAVTTQQGAA